MISLVVHQNYGDCNRIKMILVTVSEMNASCKPHPKGICFAAKLLCFISFVVPMKSCW